MLQPQEVEVWYVLPAIRRDLSEELYRRGLKKKEIASLLGLTKSAVSQYLSKKRAGFKLYGMKSEIKKAAQQIIKGSCSTFEIQKLLLYARRKGLLCRIHKKVDKVNESCNKCSKLFKWKQ